VSSRQLHKLFINNALELVELPTTTLNQEDFFYRDDTCQKHPIQILYTGRIDLAKGLLDMVQAVALLVSRGEDVTLNLVGWVDSHKDIIGEISQLSNSMGVERRVIYHGYKAVGEDLFAHYRNADVFISASQSSEGFPRTIWEAMAHSLPVVATRVGSIPDYISGAAELIEPMNVEEIANGLQRIIHQPERRKQFIRKGYDLARNNTLEVRSSEMIKIIANYLQRNKTSEVRA